MSNTQSIFEILTLPGERLPAISKWLLDEVWSQQRWEQSSPSDYLEKGEREVHRAEELMLTSAPSVYDELVSASLRSAKWNLLEDVHIAIVVLDGASIRELPILRKLAQSTGFSIIECDTRRASLPSETLYFVEQRLLGKRVAPSELPKRQEFKEKSICAVYYDAPIRTTALLADHHSYLLWSRFPDGTYKDMGSKFASHFGEMQRLYDTVWKNIVLEIPRGYRIIVTSDHGYIFFGAGMESNQSQDAARALGQDRFKFFGEHEELPKDVQGLQIVPEQRLAMLRGRIKNRPMGQSANNAYRHGGMSLMEMLTPWLVIEKE